MSAVNTLVLTGYVAQEPRITEKDGKPTVGSFSVGVNDRVWSAAEGKMVMQKSWFNCVGFGHVAKAVEAVVKPGRIISVYGRLEVSEYEVEGVKKQRPQAVVEDIVVVHWGNDGEPATTASAPAPQQEVELAEDFPF